MEETLEITAVKGAERIKKPDRVVIESLLKIYVNKRRFLAVACSPGNLEYLTLGLLFSEGLIKKKSDVLSVTVRNGCCYAEIKKENLSGPGRMVRGSGCGSSFFTPPKMEKVNAPFFTVSSAAVLYLIKELEKNSRTYHSTGGAHSAALASPERILLLQEDIGRHNAVDKVLGEALAKGIDTSDKIFLTSGRLSSEIVSKVSRANGSIIISKSAPTTWAIKLAQFYGITLVGFARGNRFNVYTYPERIMESSPPLAGGVLTP